MSVITLSPLSAQEARQVLQTWLNNTTITIGLICGNSPAAQEAVVYAKYLTDNSNNYVFVKFIHAPNLGFIEEMLRQLPCDIVDFSSEKFVFVAISATHNKIVEGVTATQFLQAHGSLKSALLTAMEAA